MQVWIRELVRGEKRAPR